MRQCTKCNELKPATREYFGSTPSGNLRGSCRTCMNKRTSQYAKNNPESVRKRAVKRKKSCSNWTASDELKLRLFNEQNGHCALSLELIDYDDVLNPQVAQVEHLIPVSKGGTNDEANLVLVLRKVNQQKCQKTLTEYIAWATKVGLPPVEFTSPKIIALLNV